MKRITVGLYQLHYSDMRGVDIHAGDTISDGKKLYKAIESKDKKFLGIKNGSDGSLCLFTEDSLPHLRKIILTDSEESAWEKIEYAPVSRDELAV